MYYTIKVCLFQVVSTNHTKDELKNIFYSLLITQYDNNKKFCNQSYVNLCKSILTNNIHLVIYRIFYNFNGQKLHIPVTQNPYADLIQYRDYYYINNFKYYLCIFFQYC